MGCGNSKDVTVNQGKSDSNRSKANEQKKQSTQKQKQSTETPDEDIDEHTPKQKQAKETHYKERDEHARKQKQAMKTHCKEIDEHARKQKQAKETPYKKIDEHARKAPASLKNSAGDLITYLSSVSKDPRILVRGIFVWISENIKYDVDGYFGTAEDAPYDSAGVMKCGKSVCGGYANVVEDLCRKANIPVKRLSGFAKGFSHSADKTITESTKTNHAWNAVQLEGKWYLIDSTWGSGHVTHSHVFEKEFNESYFLANPEFMITRHFPYMDGDMEESMEWQLLDKPVSLAEFSRAVAYESSAFRIGARAISHPNGYVEMKNELKMVFKSDGPDDIAFSARLTLRDGNRLQKQRNATYGYLENGVFTLLVHPPKVGTYTMKVFGHPVSEEKLSIPQLMTYVLKCTEVKEKEFEYPQTFSNHSEERIILRKPMSGKLKANTEVSFKIETPYLQTIKAGDTYLERSGTTFSGIVKTGASGQLLVYGNRGGKHDRKSGILQFTVS